MGNPILLSCLVNNGVQESCYLGLNPGPESQAAVDNGRHLLEGAHITFSSSFFIIQLSNIESCLSHLKLKGF